MILYEKLSVPYEKVKWRETVLVLCDYCGVEVSKTKQKIQKGRKVIQKDSCANNNCTKKKLQEINLLKHGVTNSFQRADVKEKIKKTNLHKHGVEYAQQSEEIRKKSRATCLKNYGVEHALKNKEILEKAQKKSLERHGSRFPIQLDAFKEKARKTNFDKFGIENFLSSEEAKERIKQTNIQKYGFEHPVLSKKIKEKIKETNIKRYGCENPFSSEYIKEKIKQTNIQKYGTPFPIKKFGKAQKEITEWLNSYGFNFKSDYKILEGKELDCYDSDQKLALEYCGLYWHNENSPEPRTRLYHYDKWKKCKENNIQLLTIFDDEWNNKKEVCKSLILSKLGNFEKRIYARKCLVKEISKKEMNDFCDLYHLQASNKLSLVCFGLFYENELVAVVDLGRHHRSKQKDILVLTRLCFKTGVQITGGSSKLFVACVEYCKKNKIKKIISWSDNRYSDGKIYKKLGFSKKEELKPDYYYVNIKNPKCRISKQSQSKKNSKCPQNMTELEWANSRGLSRIWDCGKARWEINI